MDLDTSNFEKPEDVKGDLPPAPGTYLCSVKSCCEHPTKKDGEPINGMRLTLEVAGGTVPGQEGRCLEQMLWYTKDDGKPTPVHVRLAMALKLIGGKQKRSVDFDQDAPGGLLFARVVEEAEEKKDEATGKYVATGKKNSIIGPSGKDRGMDVWAIDSPDCAAIARLPEVAKVLAVFQGKGPGTVPATAPPAAPAQPANATPTPAPAGDGWEGIGECVASLPVATGN